MKTPALIACLVCVSPAGADNVEVAWNPNPETYLIGYRLFIGREPGVYSDTRQLPLVTNYVVSNLFGGRFYFALTAIGTNAAGGFIESLPSEEIFYDPAGTPALPSAMRDFTVKPE